MHVDIHAGQIVTMDLAQIRHVTKRLKLNAHVEIVLRLLYALTMKKNIKGCEHLN